MTTNASPDKSPASGAGFPFGFLIGVLGGMAALYLTHSEEGQKLRQKLLNAYEDVKDTTQAVKHELVQELYEPIHKPAPKPATPDTSLTQAQSLLEKLKVKLASLSQKTPTDPTPASSSKRFFTKRR